MEPQAFAHKMQADMIREIELNPPAILVLIFYPTSWEIQPGSSHRLMDWVPDYVHHNMRQVGLIQQRNDQTTESTWGSQAATTALHSAYYVAVFKRIEAGEKPGQDQDRVKPDSLNNPIR